MEEDNTYLSSLGMRVTSPEVNVAHSSWTATVSDWRLQDVDLHCSEPTFVYMPHCPRSLHETLLSKNEASLENLLILSNDLAAYAEKWVV